LSFIQSLPPSEDLSLKRLSEKLVLPMALSNADRSSDLVALDLNLGKSQLRGLHSLFQVSPRREDRAHQERPITQGSWRIPRFVLLPLFRCMRRERLRGEPLTMKPTHSSCRTINPSNQLALLRLPGGLKISYSWQGLTPCISRPIPHGQHPRPLQRKWVSLRGTS